MGAACSDDGRHKEVEEGKKQEKKGAVEIRGLGISGNVIPPCLFCIDNGCGSYVELDFMKGEHKSEAHLKINPFGQMPSMKDGDFCLAESTAILRYLAKTYNPSAYGNNDIEKEALCDWALDFAGTNLMEQYKEIWYPVAGFGGKPKDQAASNKNAHDKLVVFANKFLAGSNKFIGGETLNIADYKFGTLVWYMSHPAIAQAPPEGSGYTHPDRITQYVKDWQEALSPKAQEFLKSGAGFMDTKVKK